MNNEIKEMMNNIENMSEEERKRQLEWSDTHEFGTAYAYYLLDYITNLQEENKDLQKRFNALLEAHKILDELEQEKQDRIDKAVELLKEAQEGLEEWCYDGYNPCLPEIIEILQGDDK